jgi:hypothetical protein
MGFCFETPDLVELRRLGFVCVIDGLAATGQLELFKAYVEGFEAPNGYFGENWNAFLDCICDLDWIKDQDVFVVHYDLPHLSQEETAIYLNILLDAVATWTGRKTAELHRRYPDFVPHRLIVYFPKDIESTVFSLLGKASSHSSSSI